MDMYYVGAVAGGAMVWHGTILSSTDCDMVWWYHSSFESLATTYGMLGGCGGMVCMSCMVMLVLVLPIPWYGTVLYHSDHGTTYHTIPCHMRTLFFSFAIYIFFIFNFLDLFLFLV